MPKLLSAADARSGVGICLNASANMLIIAQLAVATSAPVMGAEQNTILHCKGGMFVISIRHHWFQIMAGPQAH